MCVVLGGKGGSLCHFLFIKIPYFTSHNIPLHICKTATFYLIYIYIYIYKEIFLVRRDFKLIKSDLT